MVKYLKPTLDVGSVPSTPYTHYEAVSSTKSSSGLHRAYYQSHQTSAVPSWQRACQTPVNTKLHKHLVK